MKSLGVQDITSLQQYPSCIRNICILAHVDHGKTTMADSLIASNGIISKRLAGKVRYMDSRKDEQERGITMKSSAIALSYKKDDKGFLINLIDSPGHVDFSSEVSTAVRLCDGAIIVVDVVEGICPQTKVVLQQAWTEQVKPVLVLNKIDRLVCQLQMSPFEAHLHLQNILEEINAFTGELFLSDVLEKDDAPQKRVSPAADEQHIYDWSVGLDDLDDSNLYFSPDQGNVVFASALDGWAFGIEHFVLLYAKKLSIRPDILKKTLWGDFFLNSKTKRICKGAKNKGKKPLFVQFVLENIWSVYDAIILKRDKTMAEKIERSLNLKISARDSRHNDSHVYLRAIFNQWLPLADAVLGMVCEKLPSPLDISEEKVKRLMCSHGEKFEVMPDATQQLKQDFLNCNPSEDAPIIIYVSKMVSVDRMSLPENKQRPLTQEELTQRRELARQRHAEKLKAQLNDNEQTDPSAAENCTDLYDNNLPDSNASPADDAVFIAFARIFSGTVQPGKQLFVLGPKHHPRKALEGVESIGTETNIHTIESHQHITVCTIGSLFLFMGKELEQLDKVPAGNVLGIAGLEDHILKSATVASTIACPAFTDIYVTAAPILRVALEPTHPSETSLLLKGMRLLNQADPCVQMLVQQTGEHILITAGEVHLKRCLDDLRERFAGISVNVSPPIIPFRETIIPKPKVDMVNEVIEETTNKEIRFNYSEEESKSKTKQDFVEVKTKNGLCSIRIWAVPLPSAVTKRLETSVNLLKTLVNYSSLRESERVKFKGELSLETVNHLLELKQQLESAFEEDDKERWKGITDDIWAFGPQRNGPNILVNKIRDYNRMSLWDWLTEDTTPAKSCSPSTALSKRLQVLNAYDNSIVNGFQLAAFSGPLCEEPMSGVCFIIDDFGLTTENKVLESSGNLETISECNYDSDEKSRVAAGFTNDNMILTCEVSKSLSSELENHSDSIDCQQENIEDICEPSTLVTSSDSAMQLVTVDDLLKHKIHGPISGQLMSAVKDGCRRAFQLQPQRLMAAMYSCVIQATAEVLGRVYAVLSKRNGRVLSEDMKEGSQIFSITAVLPVAESIGFAEDIRKRTSGLAMPQLVFSHWEVIDIDPFWEPTTEEEYLHFGEKPDSYNQARKYMNSVRKRKGLRIQEKIVEHGEKQRTLSVKK